jgi:uncharacterized protein (TIGR00661 family)
VTKINKQTILIAPLDWGLGHATRCIPIIKSLKNAGYDILVAVCEKQKILLSQEFTDIRYVELDGYNIKYAANKWLFALKMILQIPRILQSIKKETIWLQSIIKKENIVLVISDNRYGLYNNTIPTVFITHQLTIKAPITFIENILQRINYNYINKFSECWVPDLEGANNIAGKLSHPNKRPAIVTNYIGILSRFSNQIPTSNLYDVCVLLSGPEPQRTLLENILLKQFKNQNNLKILFVRGLPQVTNIITVKGLIVKNHLQGKDLQFAICNSNIIVARSGYTTVMELISLQKKSILIPTPAQTEQEYLAAYLQQQNMCLSYKQSNINIIDAIKTANEFKYNLPSNVAFNENEILQLVEKLINSTMLKN